MPPLSPEDFHFSSMETEDMTRYVSGGYHPISIGDVLGPTSDYGYRIVHKLGYGSYATVWLAQKTDSTHSFVAVKVSTAQSHGWKESDMLGIACSGDAPSHTLTLFDHFTLHGPNGTHFVLVTEVVVPLLPTLRFKSRATPLWRKSVARHLAQALAHLHTKKIVHGDLHLGNVGLAFSQLSDQDAYDVLQDLSPYDVTFVLPTPPVNRPHSLPPYLIAPCNIAAYYKSIVRSEPQYPQTKILDFGNAHESGTQPLNFQCSLEACAPEVAFARIVEKVENPPVELPADIWALGTAIYEIFAESSIFRGGLPSLLLSAVTMTGSVPPEWQIWFSSLPKSSQISPSNAAAWWESNRAILRRNCVDDRDTDALILFLRKILILDPAKRPTAKEILQDPWLQEKREPQHICREE